MATKNLATDLLQTSEKDHLTPEAIFALIDLFELDVRKGASRLQTEELRRVGTVGSGGS
jgi:hypothetical protein